MAAPAGSHAGSVVEDAESLRYAETVVSVFGQGDIRRGLNRAQIAEHALRTTGLDATRSDGHQRIQSHARTLPLGVDQSAHPAATCGTQRLEVSPPLTFVQPAHYVVITGSAP